MSDTIVMRYLRIYPDAGAVLIDPETGEETEVAEEALGAVLLWEDIGPFDGQPDAQVAALMERLDLDPTRFWEGWVVASASA